MCPMTMDQVKAKFLETYQTMNQDKSYENNMAWVRASEMLAYYMLEKLQAQNKCVALILRERWAVDDPFLDFLIFMHDAWMYREIYDEV